MEKDSELKDVIRRLSHIETHILNMLLPIKDLLSFLRSDHMISLLNLLSRPLKIETNIFESLVRDFQKGIDTLASTDSLKIIGEIKFIGKKMNEMEEKLKELLAQGIEHNIDLNFRVDGYTLVKKPVGHDKKDQIEEPYEEYNSILIPLEAREREIVINRLGICGKDKKTFIKIGEEMGICPESVSRLFQRSLMKLRQFTKYGQSKKIPAGDLRKAIVKD